MEKKTLIEKITNPKIVKFSTIAALIVAFSCLIIGYIIAQFGPHGYNMFDNYISDMGSRRYTPFPYMRTISNLISSPLFLPLTFYMKKQLIPKSQEISKVRRILGILGYIGMLFIIVDRLIQPRLGIGMGVVNLGIYLVQAHNRVVEAEQMLDIPL